MSLLQQIQDAVGEVDTEGAIPPIADKEALVGCLAESVRVKDGRTLQAYILEQRLAEPHQFWELTTLLAPCLTSDNLEAHPQFFTTVRRCLAHFSRHGNSKEMVLALLEQVEGFVDDALFIALLPCLQNTLLRLPVKRGRSLELALDTLGCHITAISAPENWNLEGEEMILLESDETVRRFLNVVPAFLDFMQPFLEGGGAEGDGEGRLWELKVLKKHLLQLLQHPLVFLDLRFNSKAGSAKTYSREMAETVVQSLTRVESNLFRLLLPRSAEGPERSGAKTWQDTRGTDVEEADMEAENMENERKASGAAGSVEGEKSEVEISKLSAACLAYLVQVEWLGQSCWPAVHSLQYLLHTNLPHMRVLLTHPAFTAIYKGLRLLSFHLDLLADCSLDADFLDDENVQPVITALITVMVYCPIRELRLSGLAVFRAVFRKLDCPARHHMMKSVLVSCQHAGVKGVVVGLVKNEVDAAIRHSEKQDNMSDHSCNSPQDVKPTDSTRGQPPAATPTARTSSLEVENEHLLCEYFLNDKLEQLFRLATVLPDGAATDLLEQSDLVMSTLNTLRYLVLRDGRAGCVSGVGAMLPWLEKDYLTPLRTGLDMSVGHYQLELDNMTKPSQGGSRGGDDVEASVSVAGTHLPPMSREQRVNVMRSALVTFDMMRCVLARLTEVIDQKPKV